MCDRNTNIDSREGFDATTAAEYEGWLDFCDSIGDEDEEARMAEDEEYYNNLYAEECEHFAGADYWEE